MKGTFDESLKEIIPLDLLNKNELKKKKFSSIPCSPKFDEEIDLVDLEKDLIRLKESLQENQM